MYTAAEKIPHLGLIALTYFFGIRVAKADFLTACTTLYGETEATKRDKELSSETYHITGVPAIWDKPEIHQAIYHEMTMGGNPLEWDYEIGRPFATMQDRRNKQQTWIITATKEGKRGAW